MEKKKRNALFEDTMLDGVDCIMVDGNPQFVKLIDEKISSSGCLGDHYKNIFNNVKYHIPRTSYDNVCCELAGYRSLPKDTEFISILKFLTKDDVTALIDGKFEDDMAIDLNNRMTEKLSKR